MTTYQTITVEISGMACRSLICSDDDRVILWPIHHGVNAFGPLSFGVARDDGFAGMSNTED